MKFVDPIPPSVVLITEVLTKHARIALALVCFATGLPVWLQSAERRCVGHYMFASTGDAALQRQRLSRCDRCRPGIGIGLSPVTTVATDQETMRVHHTEYTMPASGMLFANDHGGGPNLVFDLLDPLHPKVAASFGDIAATCSRIPICGCPTGHVLATFRRAHHERKNRAAGQIGWSRGN